MKITIGQKVKGSKGEGTITKIITASTGYVEVTYNSGIIKKEMTFNLIDENGVNLKSKPTHKPLTKDQMIKLDKRYDRFMADVNHAELRANFLDSQIKSGNYNRNLIR